jgi:ATP-dependent Clp protease ATP-binding subunit ClpC
MFEKYTEAARRVVFLARYEALQRREPSIGAAHLLLGVLCEDVKAAGATWPPEFPAADDIRREVTDALPPVLASAPQWDVPLSEQGKRVLREADASSTRLGQSFIGPMHLIAGLAGYRPGLWERLGVGFSVRTYLSQKGIRREAVEEWLTAVQQ